MTEALSALVAIFDGVMVPVVVVSFGGSVVLLIIRSIRGVAR